MAMHMADFKILSPRLVQTNHGTPQKAVHLNPNKPVAKPKMKKGKSKRTYVP